MKLIIYSILIFSAISCSSKFCATSKDMYLSQEESNYIVYINPLLKVCFENYGDVKTAFSKRDFKRINYYPYKKIPYKNILLYGKDIGANYDYYVLLNENDYLEHQGYVRKDTVVNNNKFTLLVMSKASDVDRNHILNELLKSRN